MSWSDLLIEMDVLFVLPALLPVLLAITFVAWQATRSVARLYRSVEATLVSRRQCSGAANFHRT